MLETISLYILPIMILAILCTAVVLVVVYGGYFIATYNGSKKIIKT